MKKCLFLLVTAVLLLGRSPAFSQSPATITVIGKVTDETGGPAIAVAVVGNQREAGIYTNEEGKYSLTLSLRDTVFLEYRFPEYKTELRFVANPTAGQTYTINVKMEPYATDVIEVTTEGFTMSANEVTSTMEVVKAQRVDQFAAANVIAALQQVPGLTIYDEQPSIRGSSGYTYGAGTRVLTLLNGLPMITADRSSANFDMLPTDNIRQIEVFKGASSVLYGAGAMGGVINVITADPADTARTVIRMGTSVFDRPGNDSADWDARSSALQANLNLFHSRRLGKFDVTMMASLIHDSGYRRDEFSRRFRTMFMGKYRIFQNVENIKEMYVGLNAQFSVDSSASVLAWNNYPSGALIPGSGFLSYQLLYRYSIDPTFYLETRNATLQFQGRYFRNINEVSTGQSGTADLFYADLNYSRKFGQNLQVLGGLNYTQNSVDSDSAFGVATADQYAAFVQARLRVGQRLNLMLGARYQYEYVVGDTVSSPERKGKSPKMGRRTIDEPIFRIGANYQAGLGSFIRASFGQAVRSPSVAERFTSTQAGPITVIPAPNIQVERGWTAELGYRQLYQLGTKMRGFLDVAAFWMEFENMVEFYVDGDALIKRNELAFSAQNLSAATVRGFEANLNYQFQPNDRWGIFLTGGITWADPIDNNGQANLDGDDSVPKYTQALLLAVSDRWPLDVPFPQDRPQTLKYRSRTMVRGSLDLTYQRWTLTTNYRYTSNMVNVDKVFLTPVFPGVNTFRSNRDRGWSEFDFILSYNLPAVTFSLHAFNAFNTQFMTVPGTMGEHRRFAFQARFTL